MRWKYAICVLAAITLMFSDTAPRDGAVRSLTLGKAEAQANNGRGNSASAPGRSGGGPGNSASAPGRSGGGPGNSASAPGRSGSQTQFDEMRAANAGQNSDAQQAPPPEPPQAATAPRIRPQFVPPAQRDSGERSRQNEISVVGLDSARRNALQNAGFGTITSRQSRVLGNRDVSRLTLPPGVTPEAAAAFLRQNFPDVIADLSHFYRPAAQPTSVSYGHDLIGLIPAACQIGTRIGLIDTGVGRHPTLQGKRLTQRNFVDIKKGGSFLHGTALASLLVGDLAGVQPLAPGARLYSANVFAGEQGVLLGDVNAIIEALDWMLARDVRVVNMSLVGPPNDLLEEAVLGAAKQSVILVAAGGNDGPSAPPSYPAAYNPVIAVSAVDDRGRPYSNSNRGSYVEISAPGVDIWAANVDGGEAFWTGTSFATPFVSAALAREVDAGTVSNINDARRYLSSSARDLGASGRDPIYGYGLLQARSCRR